MEACGSAHHWARKLEGYGHTVKLMAPQFVKPYVKTNKNDMADAEAICEAVADPDSWLRKLMDRRNKNVAAVGLANKNARTVWALLALDRLFRHDYTAATAAAV